jgi:hypothetical protein
MIFVNLVELHENVAAKLCCVMLLMTNKIISVRYALSSELKLEAIHLKSKTASLVCTETK